MCGGHDVITPVVFNSYRRSAISGSLTVNVDMECVSSDCRANISYHGGRRKGGGYIIGRGALLMLRQRERGLTALTY